MTSSAKNHVLSKDTPDHVAAVLAALGDLMRNLHSQDLALQGAVSQLAATSPGVGAQLPQIQHIDLITQTHRDLASFLPELAACLAGTEFDHVKLGQKLRLQSIRDQLLNTSTDNGEASCGDVSIF